MAHNLLLCQFRTPGPFMCVVLGIRRDVTLWEGKEVGIYGHVKKTGGCLCLRISHSRLWWRSTIEAHRYGSLGDRSVVRNQVEPKQFLCHHLATWEEELFTYVALVHHGTRRSSNGVQSLHEREREREREMQASNRRIVQYLVQ